MNDPDFNPTTEIVPDLHSDYLEEIDLSHSCVAAYHEATPEYVEKRFQGMIVDLKRGIANWEKSGAGDGGRDDDTVMSPVLTELDMRREMNCLDRFVGATRAL